MSDIEYVKREVIDNQLLIALDDKSKVAVVLSEEDLNLLISAATLQMLQRPAPGEHHMKKRLGELLYDMTKLKSEAFQ